MPHSARSSIPADWLVEWLGGERLEGGEYTQANYREADRSPAIEMRLAQMIQSAKCAPARLARLLQRVGYLGPSARLAPPQTIQGRHGDFGEVLAIGLLEALSGEYVPIVKLRYQMDRDQSLHGTDIVAFTLDEPDDGSITSLDFVEVKVSTSTKYNAKAAVLAAHDQLTSDRAKHFTDTLEFLAERLEETHPSLSAEFDNYLASRDDDPGGSNRIVMVIDRDIYEPSVLEDLPSPPDLCTPLHVDVLHVEKLRDLIAEVWPHVSETIILASGPTVTEVGA